MSAEQNNPANDDAQEAAVLIEQIGPTRRLIMNRAKSRNALSEEMMQRWLRSWSVPIRTKPRD